MTRFARRVALTACALLMSISLSEAAAERRVALVIGNGKYDAVARLPNPIPDAEMVAASLRDLGFDRVTLADDLPREKLVEALRTFSADASNADWAVIYYAGHGIEMGGVNYLIPTDARLATDRDVQFEAVPLTQVMAAVEGARKLHLVILDACRDNPFAAKMSRGLGATRSVGRGLARVEPEVGTLVAYAARDGQVAEDGDGAHSPFVTSLVRHMRTPGLEVARLFRRVTSDVLVATNRRQEPFTYGSLPDQDFYFSINAAPPATEGKAEAERSTAPAPAPSRASTTDAPAPASLAVDKPTILPPPAALASQPPAAQSRPKPVASVEPRATPRLPVRPDSPPVKVKPLVQTRLVHKPEPVMVKPHRVVQQVEAPAPRPAGTAVRAHPSAAPARASTHCVMFNGERVCD